LISASSCDALPLCRSIGGAPVTAGGQSIRCRLLPLFSFLDTLLNDNTIRQVVMSSLLLLCCFWGPLDVHLHCLTLPYNPVNERCGPGTADVSHAKAPMVSTLSSSTQCATIINSSW
jgi:hypothetical protein